jgi:hypothetical protein
MRESAPRTGIILDSVYERYVLRLEQHRHRYRGAMWHHEQELMLVRLGIHMGSSATVASRGNGTHVLHQTDRALDCVYSACLSSSLLRCSHVDVLGRDLRLYPERRRSSQHELGGTKGEEARCACKRDRSRQ